MHKLSLLMLTALGCAIAAPAADDKLPEWAKGATVDVQLNDPKAATEFVVSDPAVWKHVVGEDRKGFLELQYDKKTYKSTYNPKHRSPVHIALLNTAVTDFVMDVELMSTVEAYGHQDLCLFFGFESPEKYYYVHVARAADPNAHNVFIVNDAARKNIATETTKGVDWKKDTWHTVRLVRQATTGATEVYFDDMTKPIMKASDKTFQTGLVGFGSFDDTGRFRRLTLRAKSVDSGKKVDFFKGIAK